MNILNNPSNYIQLSAFESQVLQQQSPLDLEHLSELLSLLDNNQETDDDDDAHNNEASNNDDTTIFTKSYYNSDLQLYLTISAYIKLLLTSTTTAAGLSLSDALQLWFIRLNLLLMSTNLKLPDANSIIPIIPNSKFLKNNESQLIFNELIKLDGNGNEITTIPNRATKEEQVQTILDDPIHWNLKILLNRLKYSSSLLLINYEFNEVIALRSSNTSSTCNKVKSLLFNITSIMIARQEYLTIFNLLFDTVQDLQQDPKNDDSAYISQIALLTTLIGLLRIFKESSNSQINVANPYYSKILKVFKSIHNEHSPFSQLIKVLNSIEPIYNDTAQIKGKSIMELNESKAFGVEELSEMISGLQITGRILCCLCGVYELELDGETHDHDKIRASESFIKLHWTQNVNNFYAFE